MQRADLGTAGVEFSQETAIPQELQQRDHVGGRAVDRIAVLAGTEIDVAEQAFPGRLVDGGEGGRKLADDGRDVPDRQHVHGNVVESRAIAADQRGGHRCLGLGLVEDCARLAFAERSGEFAQPLRLSHRSDLVGGGYAAREDRLHDLVALEPGRDSEDALQSLEAGAGGGVEVDPVLGCEIAHRPGREVEPRIGPQEARDGACTLKVAVADPRGDNRRGIGILDHARHHPGVDGLRLLSSADRETRRKAVPAETVDQPQPVVAGEADEAAQRIVAPFVDEPLRQDLHQRRVSERQDAEPGGGLKLAAAFLADAGLPGELLPELRTAAGMALGQHDEALPAFAVEPGDVEECRDRRGAVPQVRLLQDGLDLGIVHRLDHLLDGAAPACDLGINDTRFRGGAQRAGEHVVLDGGKRRAIRGQVGAEQGVICLGVRGIVAPRKFRCLEEMGDPDRWQARSRMEHGDGIGIQCGGIVDPVEERVEPALHFVELAPAWKGHRVIHDEIHGPRARRAHDQRRAGDPRRAIPRADLDDDVETALGRTGSHRVTSLGVALRPGDVLVLRFDDALRDAHDHAPSMGLPSGCRTSPVTTSAASSGVGRTGWSMPRNGSSPRTFVRMSRSSAAKLPVARNWLRRWKSRTARRVLSRKSPSRSWTGKLSARSVFWRMATSSPVIPIDSVRFSGMSLSLAVSSLSFRAPRVPVQKATIADAPSPGEPRGVDSSPGPSNKTAPTVKPPNRPCP